jgi:RNA polymerase sigma-70 factor (ECF subfamily)
VSEADELYERLIIPIEQKLKAIVLRIVRDPNDADDVMQETLAVVWKKLDKIDRDANPHGYILRICISRAYDLLRSRARRRRRESRAAHAARKDCTATDGPAARAMTAERAEAVRNAVGLLPPRQAKAVLLRVVEGSSYGAIACILGCSEATARSHCSKGTARLRSILTEFGIL